MGRGFRISNQFEQLPNCQIREFPTGELIAGKPVWVSYTAEDSPGCDGIQRIPAGDWVWKRYENGQWKEVFRLERKRTSTKNSWSWMDAPEAGQYQVFLENTGFTDAFSIRALTINIDQERQERTAADQDLSDRIGGLDRWARDQVAGILASIEDIVQRAEEEASAWRKALDDFQAGLYAWLVDRVLNVLMTALDRTAEAHIGEKYGIVPEGPSWAWGIVGAPDNSTTLPFDPDAVREASERIAEMRHQAWKSDRRKM